VCGAGHSEALVEEQSTTINPPEPGASIAFYRAALPLSRPTLAYVTGVSRRHRKSIGSVWRKLTAGKQALLVLLYLRKGTADRILGCRDSEGPFDGDDHVLIAVGVSGPERNEAPVVQGIT
jgi:hypothetical protein